MSTKTNNPQSVTTSAQSSQTASQKPRDLTTPVSSGHPIKSLVEDRYGLRHHFIPRLARIAIEWPSKDGLVVGLFGSWGIGKTSILNMFQNHIEQNKEQHKHVLTATFNPWFYEDTGALVTSFFATIAEELSTSTDEPLQQAAKALKAMGTFLTVESKGISLLGLTVDAHSIKEAVDAGVSSFKGVGEFSNGLAELTGGGHKKLEQHKSKIEAALNSLGDSKGRIIILIDDVDRLNKTELLSLLRLIRTIADLPYMTIIVAMDDERVRDILKDAVSEGYGQGFLDKIIQAPVHIPLPSSESMITELSTQLELTFKARNIPFPAELIFNGHYSSLELQQLAPLISTPRDLARYINGIRVLMLAGETPDIHPTDAALIEALHIFHPEVYDRVRRNKGFLTEPPSYRVSRMLSVLDAHDDAYDREQEKTERIAKIKSITGENEKPFTHETRARIYGLLKLLFGDLVEPQEKADQTEDAANRRIKSHHYFDNYFRHSNTEGSVTRSEVNDLFERFQNHAKNKYTTEIAKNLTDAFANRDESALNSMIRDLGHKFSSISLDQLEQLGNGAIIFAEQSPSNTAISLIEEILKATTGLRIDNHDPDEWNSGGAQTLAHSFLKTIFNSKTPSAHTHLLLIRLVYFTSDRDQQVELTIDWFKQLKKDLHEHGADPFGRGHTHGTVDFFLRVQEIIEKLREKSPISSSEFKDLLLAYVERRPYRLPLVLYLSAVRHKDTLVLIHPQRPLAETMKSLQDRLGDYKRLHSAYRKFKEGTYDDYRVGRLIEDFGEILIAGN